MAGPRHIQTSRCSWKTNRTTDRISVDLTNPDLMTEWVPFLWGIPARKKEQAWWGDVSWEITDASTRPIEQDDLQEIISRLDDMYREITSDASTRPIDQDEIQALVDDDLAEQVHQIFRSAELESFDFGRESIFSRQIVDFVKEQGKKAVSALDDFVAESRWNPELVAESLLWLGDMNDPATHETRRGLLLGTLTNKSIVIRADAITALKFMGDLQTIPHLRRALDREPVPELKLDLIDAIKYLETLDHAEVPACP